MSDIRIEHRGGGWYHVEGKTEAGIALVNQFIGWGEKTGKTDFGCTGIEPFKQAIVKAGLVVELSL